MMSRLPEPIELGFLRLKVVAVSTDLAKDDGEFQPEEGRILVRRGLKGRFLVDAVNHELHHAKWYLAMVGEWPRVDEESLVGIFSMLDTELHVRNPHLFQWIQDTIVND
jgi:hypothetical protein